MSDTTSSRTPIANSSEAHEWRSSWMLQCPNPARLQMRGTVRPKASGSSGVPMVDVKTRLAELRQIRLVRCSWACRARCAYRRSTRGCDRCKLRRLPAVLRSASRTPFPPWRKSCRRMRTRGHVTAELQVVPGDAEQLTSPEPECKGEDVGGLQTVTPDRSE